MPATKDRRHINVDDVTGLKGLLAWNPVTHDMIDRDTAALGITAVTKRRWKSARFDRHLVDDIVQFLHRGSRNDVRHQGVENLGGETTGSAHAFEPFRAVKLDDAALCLNPVIRRYRDVLCHDI